MKIKILSILSFTMLLFAACENELEEAVAFDVNATAEGSTMSGDTLVVKKSTPINFLFSGNADFITFYNGNAGSEYSKRNLLESPVAETTSELKFGAMPQYGVFNGTLNVYLSTSFEGLLLNNKAIDSTAVAAHKWIDITSLCNLSTASGSTKNAVVPLQEYLGKRITIAFRYKTEQNATTQPTWEITNLQIVNTLTSGSSSTLKASTMGFGVLDMLSLTTPYKNTTGPGNWDISSVASATPKMRIGSSPAGQPMNEDWLISNPIVINSRMPDAGTAIKAMASRLDSYQYKFDAVGKYTVSFVAIKGNYLKNSEVVKELIVKVIE